jgi:succinyl-CoA synthetase alpha subunit
MLDRLLAPPAITIVGASPNGHITNHLLRNLENRSCRFGGRINLVNPAYRRLFDRECIGSVAEVSGDPGLVYLQVRPEACLPALEAMPQKPHGVILFPDGSGGPGGYEEGVARWGDENGVAILGPQSNGLIGTAGRVNGLLIPIVEDLSDGPVAILAQSGGVLGGIVKYLAQRGIGIHAALEYGTACQLSAEALGTALLARPEVRILALYADGLGSIGEFAAMLQAARAADKPVVAMLAGVSEAGGRAAGSHSGMAAAPRRILEGIAAQYGAILARTLDELAWSVEALDAVGYERPRGRQVAVFSDSGGGGIVIADALAVQGVELVAPNPFDFGSASMGRIQEHAETMGEAATNPEFGVFAFASTIGMATRELSVHVRQLDDFNRTAQEMGKVSFVASPLPFTDLDEAAPFGPRALLGRGSTESAVKLKALSTWARDAAPARAAAPGVANPAAAGADHGSVLSGEVATEHLSTLPLRWPEQVSVRSAAELASVPHPPFPLVVKTEAGLAHRARGGGVLTGIESEQDLRNAATYLLEHFQGPVSISEQVAHDDEYFLGAHRDGSLLVMLFGRGGDEAERADLRLVPLTHAEAESLTRAHAPAHTEELVGLIMAFQSWLLERPWVESVDLNPIVPHDGLTALDAKIHGTPPA